MEYDIKKGSVVFTIKPKEVFEDKYTLIDRVVYDKYGTPLMIKNDNDKITDSEIEYLDIITHLRSMYGGNVIKKANK